MLADQRELFLRAIHPDDWTRLMALHERLSAETQRLRFFVRMRRTQRGHYEMQFVPLAEAGEQLPAGAFTERYARLVEAQIREYPADWPWSHKRWKLKRSLYAGR